MTSSPSFSGVLFGAAYYPEYQPAGDLERDFDLMVGAGFSVIRVGESVWSTWEPRAGEFDLDWLQPTLDMAYERGIRVVLGTPTYAVPPWLQRLHPEIAAEVATGVRHGWGARQEMDQSHPVYRFYAERVARQVIARYAAHPAVIGYQVDNEPGMRIPHNEHTFQRFVDWLKGRYGTVDELNSQWGLVYWSHRLSDWADLWRPDGNAMPEYQLEWRRYQASLATELIAWQAELVREYAREDQFVTTCLSYTRPQVRDEDIARSLDVVAGNPYYRMQQGLDWDAEALREELWWHTSVWALFQWGDRAWSSAQAQYLVTETNAQSVGGSWQNFPPFAGQLRQAAFALLARGGRMIEYWHWHTLTYGGEAYWGGVLPHSGKPGRIYREVAALGADLRAVGASLDAFEPDADVLMLWSTETKWAFEFVPPLANDDGSPDSEAYQQIFDAFYQGFFESGAQVRIQHPSQFLAMELAEVVRRFPVLVAPALYVADDDLLQALRAYAAAGGHLIVGVRTAYADDLGRVRRAVAPAVLAAPAGVHYDEYSNLTAPLAVEGTPELPVDLGSAGTSWVELLEIDDAEVIASFETTELGAAAAVTTRRFDAGAITYVATVPNRELSRSVARWAVPDSAKRQWDASEQVSVTTGSAAHGPIAFVSNWSADTTSVTAPADLRDLVSDTRHACGDVILLEPRAAHVFALESAGHLNG